VSPTTGRTEGDRRSVRAGASSESSADRSPARFEALARMARTFAHDFNNTLAAVQLHAQLLADLVDGEAREDIEAILGSVRAAGEITARLGQLGQRAVNERTVVDLNQLLADHEGDVRQLAGPGIRVVVEPTRVAAPVLLVEGPGWDLLTALVTNAVEAMAADGGTLTVGVVTFDASDRDAGARGTLPAGRYHGLRVSDTGPGLERSVEEHLFEPFVTTKRDRRGRGLSLALAYWRVLECDGFIDVSTAPQGGAQFTMYFPAEDRPGRREQAN